MLYFGMKKEDKSVVVEKLSLGQFCRDFSGRFTYEVHDFPSEHFKDKKKEIRQKFSLLPISFSINTPDESFQTFVKGIKPIGIEWDNWSGLCVVAKHEKADDLVKEIGEYLEQTIKI